MDNKKKNDSTYNIIIVILVILIIGVGFLLLTDNKMQEDPKTNPEQEKEPEESSILTITLKGEKEVTIITGQTFEDPGYFAYDSKEGDLSSRVITSGTVDTNTVGSYTITYTITNSAGIKTETTRTIYVIADLNITVGYNPKELTNNNVTVYIKITGDCLDSVTDPVGNVTKNKESEYKISKNGDYKFVIKRTDGVTIDKDIKIKNIDKVKPTGTCKNTITENKTTITVTAKDENGIDKYVYKYNNKSKESNNSSHTVNEVANNVTVTIYDKAGNKDTITCTKKDDSWPVLTNPNYQNHSAKNYKQNTRYAGKMNYLIYYPDNMDLSKKHPLVVYFHGIGEFGRDINMTLYASSAFAQNMKNGRFQQQAIFLAPQCYSGSKRWSDCFTDVKGLIDQVTKEYNVDTKRISLTGHSLGGQAVFDFIVKYPGLLAAAAPLSPSYPWNHDYTKMKDLKIAVFIGTKEGLYTKDQPEIEYLKNNGVNLRFYPLEGVTHSSQKALYTNTKVIDWMISQSR